MAPLASWTPVCSFLKKGLLRGEARVRPVYGFVLAALALQVTLGISNVLLYLPLNVAVAHNLGGALLLISLVMLSYFLRFEKIKQ